MTSASLNAHLMRSHDFNELDIALLLAVSCLIVYLFFKVFGALASIIFSIFRTIIWISVFAIPIIIVLQLDAARPWKLKARQLYDDSVLFEPLYNFVHDLVLYALSYLRNSFVGKDEL